jgi:hypothetical protein
MAASLHDRCADAGAAGNRLASLMTVAPGFAATSCSDLANGIDRDLLRAIALF